MKNPKTGALIFILVIVLIVVVPKLWDRLMGTNEPAPTPVVCSGGPSTVSREDLTPWDSTENYPKKGEMVTFEGYAAMPNMTYLNGGTYMVWLLEDSALSGEKVVLQIKEGDCENTMLPLPDNYENDDLVIYDNRGKEIKQGEKLRVTGKVSDDGTLYMIYAKRIEKL